MKDPLDRIRELEDQCEALQQALIDVRAATWEPNIRLAELRRRVAQILLDVHNRVKKFGS